MLARRDGTPASWTGHELVDALLERGGFDVALWQRVVAVTREALEAVTADGLPDWPARQRAVEQVTTWLGLKRVELPQISVTTPVTIHWDMTSREIAPASDRTAPSSMSSDASNGSTSSSAIADGERPPSA
jgi:hypothetical protein